MSAVVGSCGAYVPMPMRPASEMKMRSTGIFMKSPAMPSGLRSAGLGAFRLTRPSSSRARHSGHSSPVISTP